MSTTEITEVPIAVEAAPEPPPHTVRGTLRRLGPGLILAGAIVGSGELIATTMVGAEAGFWLLWLILMGCVLKVFTQIELGRYTVTWNRTSLEGMNELPGPRYRRVNWLIWYWFVIVLLIISQNGGIVGGVGQALAIMQPLTDGGRIYNETYDLLIDLQVSAAAGTAGLEAQIASLSDRVAAMPQPADIAIWAGIVAVITSVLMYIGRYDFIQVASTIMVGTFTAVTIGTVVMLQVTDWSISWESIRSGLTFRLPPVGESGVNPVGVALAAFGMIGLSAGELIMYPYWCLEEGYARLTGPRDATPAWGARARGWMRVMRVDAWLSMVVYTISTVAFYLLGAAVLSRTGLAVRDEGLVRTLAEMYEPVLGSWAENIFLFGAFTILYSTYFVFAAGFSRILADALILMGFVDQSRRKHWIRIIGVSLPLIALVVYLFVRAPVGMVLAAGVGQATILPMLGAAALYFRYKRIDLRLRPSLIWDIFLWISVFGLLVAGVWSLYSTVT